MVAWVALCNGGVRKLFVKHKSSARSRREVRHENLERLVLDTGSGQSQRPLDGISGSDGKRFGLARTLAAHPEQPVVAVHFADRVG